MRFHLGARSCALFVLGVAAAANAAPPQRAECFDAYEQGQRHRKARELGAARKSFISCSNDVCPASIKSECARWAGEVETDIPTVILSARRAGGRDLADVRVTLDGAELTRSLDGRALEIDPGEHVFRFEAEGQSVQQTWVIREREKGRVLALVFDEPDTSELTRPSAGRSPLPWIFGGVGLVALGSFTYFGLHGRSQQSSLDDRGCKPRCPQDDVDDLERSYLVANVSLGVSLLALGGAAYFYLSERSQSVSDPHTALGFAATPGGVLAGARGEF